MTSCNAIEVVLVDYDASFRSALAANLVDDGHVVHEFEHPRSVGPERLAAASVLLTDFDLGDTDGLTFADRVHRTHPTLAILLITAYWTSELEAGVAARPSLHLCRKPLDYDLLHDRLHDLASER